MIDPQIPLSSAGLRKREQILALALRASSRRRHRRIVVRCALGCVMAVGALSLLLRIEHGTSSVPIHARTVDPIPPTPTPVPLPAPGPDFARLHRNHEIIITRVQTDPQVTNQLAVHATTGSIQRIGDDQLLEQLAQAQQPAGLARLGGKTLLLFRNSRQAIQPPE